ncbi:MAG: hypothetical protein UE295_10040 [Acutalibacteraceae bacterium]|nr:hypothetical protein [Acutalibacteraceae bacterium]
MRSVVNSVIINVGSCLSIHDFRMVRGKNRTKLVFDVVIPYSMEKEESNIKIAIDEAVKSEGIQYDTVICFDKQA